MNIVRSNAEDCKVSPKNRAMSLVLRLLMRIFQKSSGRDVDVEFVHGSKKYQIAPKYSKEARRDALRQQDITGSAGTKKRKILGENDTGHLLEINGEKNMIRFLKTFSPFTDQISDMADSYLIARSAFEHEA